MKIQHALVPTLLLLAACAPSAPRTTIAPRMGPTGTIRALYDGGLLRRRVSAQFSLNESAYVVVGHLGGDGMISVVYPKRAYPLWAEKGHVYRTDAFAGDYDAAPEYYFMSFASIRSPAARTYSYDGRGHGFVFMITSKRPLRLDRISDFAVWDNIEVVDYERMLDPRRAIREYADMLADGAPYSLTYAQSFTAYSYTNYADAWMDCAMLSTLAGPWSYASMGSAWYAGVGPSWWLSPIHSTQGYCGGGYSYAYGWWGPQRWGWTPRPVFNTPVPQPPVTPVAQRTPRPTFTPTIPTERRTPARRGDASAPPARRGDVLSYRPTWAENPTFAPAPTERVVTRRSVPSWSTPTASSGSRRDDWPSRRDNPGTSTTSTTTASPSPSTSSPAPAPAPTMSPSHGGSSQPSRRPPSN